MANGFAPYLLLQLAAIFDGKAGAKKITPPGFTKMLLDGPQPDVISSAKSDNMGNIRDVHFYYRQPGVPGQSATTDNCDVDATVTRRELVIPSTLFRKKTLFFDDTIIAQYNAEAKNIVKPNINGMGNMMALNESTFSGVLKEVYEIIIEQIGRGLIPDINNDLLNLQAASFGVNQVSGSNAARTVNFPLNATNLSLSSGMTQIIAEGRANEFNLDDSYIIGGGLLDNYMVNAMYGAQKPNQAGLDNAALNIAKKYFYDVATQSAWGANQFGVFDKGTTQFLDINRFVGFKAGSRPGSIFFNAPLPLVDSLGDGALSKMSFDWQIEYSSCPQTLTIDGTEQAVGRGWIVTISKSYYLVNQPSDMYAAGDRLLGNNGTLRYTLTNA